MIHEYSSIKFIDKTSPIHNTKNYIKSINEINEWIESNIPFELSRANEKELISKIPSNVDFTYFDENCNLSTFPRDDFKLLETEGDYSCLIHSVLLAISKIYKKIPRDECCDSEEYGENISLRSYIGKKYRIDKLLEFTKDDAKNKRMVKNIMRFLGNEHLEEIANNLGIIIILFSHNEETYKCTGETIIDNTVTPLGNRVKLEKTTPVIFIFGDGYHFQTMIYKKKCLMKLENAVKISDQMNNLLKIFSS